MTRWPGAISSQLPRQAAGDRGAGLVVVGPDRGLLRFGRQRNKDVAIERLPHVRHEPAAVGVELADWQLLGHFSDIRVSWLCRR